MKVMIAGATGFVGTRLVTRLLDRKDEVVVLTRDAARARQLEGPGCTITTYADIAATPPEGVDAVVNLAGENLFARRWNPAFKETIRKSRIDATRSIVEALRRTATRPAVLVNASATGFYGPHGDENLTEDAPAGSDFLAGVCKEWEEAAQPAADAGTRVVLLRTGVVLGRDGGALAQMVTPFRMFVGGPVGSGSQWLSWIHIDDLAGILLHALDTTSLSGPLNGTAPNPRTNREFSAALGKALGRPSWLPMPGFAMRMAVGEVAEVILTGQRVLPKKALDSGFVFRFPDLDAALKDLMQEIPAAKSA